MKRALTFLILLFAFLRLSATAVHIDTLNLSPTRELPLLVVHPEKLMVWTKSNNFNSPESAIAPVFTASVVNNGDLPLFVLHPEKLLVWTESNFADEQKPSIPTFFKPGINSGNLPMLVVHPQKLIAWTKANRAEDSELPLSVIIVNVLKKGDLPLLILHPEKLPLWTKFKVAVGSGISLALIPTDSLKLPVVPYRAVVTLKPPTIALHLQSFKKEIKQYGADSLKTILKTTANDSLKVLLYTEIANRYVNNDSVSDKAVQAGYQAEALTYTMKALHLYSRYGDTTGLRMCYDNLAKVYFFQKKYVQAKWFILQSNSLSRAKNDVPNVIKSLLLLSAIKSEIKDDKLAMNDLDEALRLSITKHYPQIELEVLKSYALYYSRLQNYPKEALMIKKRDSLQENIRKKEEAAMLAKMALQDSTQKKKLDSLNKKKVFTSNTRKLYKSASAKRMASL